MSKLQQWIDQAKELSIEDLQRTLESYSDFGPLPGLLLTYIESFFPFLPLLLIVAANANIYGLWLGFLLSWIGVSAGAASVFWVARLLGGKIGTRLQRRYPKMKGFFNWIETKGFTPLFLLSCFPFSPSSLINIVSGLSTIPFPTFLIAVALGKAVMIFSVSLLSFDIGNLLQEPWRIALTAAVIVAMWYGGKRLEARYHH
ncbi:hypothetical protein IJ21_47580 [Paenibacillus sp. 32O-W]|jgi:uncharacterized membrane protein YdjX (TVP38/TMEM64 family)|uniref:TVP38/TMEM64 family membrane protein n=1 Tax=Paenibacillus cisolokensis TaxID=1658519 RepID=A0ABQ4N096_9BACL|nr:MULTISPECIES: TVP38/TMEM64 family protein [Paenibacillus]ALS30120.1 hypothetical protein IJ21_47580 [Paenibacillus sp. 32O-W]GIQ61587.1 putative membrane protein YhjE [Paenibacillus cisolokensis]